MSIFVGNTFTKVNEVRHKYSEIEYYETTHEDDENFAYKEVVLKEDFDNRIRDIESDVNSIIKTLEGYDLSSALDDLKILAEKLY